MWKCFYVSWWPSDLVLKALDSQSRVRRFETNGWLQGHLSLSSFRGQSMEYQDLLESWELNDKKETVSLWWLCSLQTVEPHP